MKIELLDSRRLTGPNLYSNQPGAILDIAVDDIAVTELITAWGTEVQSLMEAVGWPAENICSRVFDGGVSLVINAPIDVLYSACELNELAFNRATAVLAEQSPLDIRESLPDLLAGIAKEANPALLALQGAAARFGLPFLWDDDAVSVGYGKNSLTWPVDDIPAVDTLNWQAVTAVPLGIVTGTNGKSTTVRLASSILSAAGLSAGITSTDYIRVGEEILDRGDYSGPGGARTLLRHPRSEAVVLEVARGGLLRRGIGVEHADAALITNIAVDHLGEYGINSVAEMAEVKFIVRRALGADAPLILNADDEDSVRLAATIDNRVIWFGLDAAHPVLKAQLEKQGTAAYLSEGWLELTESGQRRRIVAAKDIPITFGGVARYNISNALGAMLLCRVLGADDRALAQGLMAFSGDAGVNPGRGNLFEKNGVRVFLDFAHNEHGIRAVSDTVRAFQARRLLVLIGQAGDRTDQEIANLVNAACNLNPSRLLVCDLPGYERGRQPGKVAEMIRDYALEEGLPEQAVTLFGNPLDGVRQALKEAVKGDCVVLLAPSQRDEVLTLIRSFVEGR